MKKLQLLFAFLAHTQVSGVKCIIANKCLLMQLQHFVKTKNLSKMFNLI